jgi:phage FluMu gp28-like protein
MAKPGSILMKNNRLPSLGINLYPYQQEYLRDDNRFVVAMWCRGGGKSKMTALKIALDVFDNEARGVRSDWLIVSATSPQAQECLRLVEGWSKLILGTAVALNIIEEEVEFRTEDGLSRYTRFRLRLGKSSQVIALSASPAAIRGYTSNCFWDEACHFADDAKMWAALQHITRGRLKMIVASTPVGTSESQFHKIVHDESIVRGKPLWSKHIVDIHKAIADGRLYDLESEKAAADPFSWRSEMLLEFTDSPNTWFSSELIAACEDARASAVGHGYNRGRCFIGNDVGLRHDKWCAFVLEATEDFGVHIEDCPNGQKISYYTGELITREVVVLDRSSFAEHDRQIARLMAKYNVIRMAIDRTGMGERSTEEYQNLYGSKVEGVNFTTDTKGNMATLGLELMTERRVLLPQDHPEIGADFRKLQRVVSAGGNVRFQAARDNSGHGDVVWSFLLACNAAYTPQTPVEVKSSGESAQEQNIMTGWTTGLEGMRSGR